MKLVLFAAALTLGGAALAQSTAGPEVDARGIPVVSAPATAPAGANQAVTVEAGVKAVPAPNQSAVFATQESSRAYVPCTREVTDGCVQTYEGRRSGKATTKRRSRRR